MALQSFTITIGALTDSGNNGKNYVNNQPVYIKNIGGTLANIYRDLAGTSPITQDGIANVTDNRGQFTFFVEAGDYNAEYNSQVTPITVVGADYFNSRIDETVNQIILDLSTSRGFRVQGTFAAGFTYELPNDVGFDASGNAWVYTDVDALPFTVPASTTPSLPSYTQVTFNDHGVLANRGAIGAHDEIYIRRKTTAQAKAETNEDGVIYYLEDRRYYFKVSSDALTANEIDILAMAGGKFLVYMPADVVEIEHLGITPSLSVDASAALNLAIAKYPKVTCKGGNYKISNTVTLSKTGSFYCGSMGKVKFVPDASLVGYVFDGITDPAPFVGAEIGGFTIEPSTITSGQIGMGLQYFTVGSSLKDFRTNRCDGGLVVQKGWSAHYENLYLRDGNGIGLELISPSGSEQTNGITIINPNIQGFLHNIKSTGAPSRTLNLIGGAIERSKKTAFVNENIKPVTMVGTYFEANHTDGDATEASPADILNLHPSNNQMDDAALNLLGVYFKSRTFTDTSDTTHLTYTGILYCKGGEVSAPADSNIRRVFKNNGTLVPNISDITLDGTPVRLYEGVQEEGIVWEGVMNFSTTQEIRDIVFRWPTKFSGELLQRRLFIGITPETTATWTREASFRFHSYGGNTSDGNQILTGTDFTVGTEKVFEINKVSGSNDVMKGFSSQTAQGSGNCYVRIFWKDLVTRDFPA